MDVRVFFTVLSCILMSGAASAEATADHKDLDHDLKTAASSKFLNWSSGGRYPSQPSYPNWGYGNGYNYPSQSYPGFGNGYPNFNYPNYGFSNGAFGGYPGGYPTGYPGGYGGYSPGFGNGFGLGFNSLNRYRNQATPQQTTANGGYVY